MTTASYAGGDAPWSSCELKPGNLIAVRKRFLIVSDQDGPGLGNTPPVTLGYPATIFRKEMFYLTKLYILNIVRDMVLKDNFRTLNLVGNFIVGLGWLLMLIGVVIALVTYGYLNSFLTSLGIIGIGVVFGIILVAQGQLLLVVHGIERNTRASAMVAGVTEQDLGQGVQSSGSAPGSVAKPVAQVNRSGQNSADFEKDW